MASYKAVADAYGLHMVMLVTPETDEERIRLIDRNTDGFIYMVSSAGTTGVRSDFRVQQAYFDRVAAMNLRNPCMIGFGISNRATYEAAASHAAGAIVGSKFVSLLDEMPSPSEAVEALLATLKR